MGNNDVEAYIYWVLGEIIVLNYKKFENLNINKSYFCIFDGIEGISTVDLYTKTYFMP